MLQRLIRFGNNPVDKPGTITIHKNFREYQPGKVTTLSSLIAGMLLLTGGFFMMGCEKYDDAPMTQEMYEYLKKTRVKQSKETDKKLTEIVKRHIPLGTPIEDTLKFSTANHFDCGGPWTKKLPPEADAQYGCSLQDILTSHIFSSSAVGFWIYTKEGKVVNISADFGLYAP